MGFSQDLSFILLCIYICVNIIPECVHKRVKGEKFLVWFQHGLSCTISSLCFMAPFFVNLDIHLMENTFSIHTLFWIETTQIFNYYSLFQNVLPREDNFARYMSLYVILAFSSVKRQVHEYRTRTRWTGRKWRLVNSLIENDRQCNIQK